MAAKGRTLPHQIFEILEAGIIDRIYPPGFHLVEDEVAAQLNVSRTPVREAFRMLQRAGWLQLQPHAGAYVRHPSIEETRELFEVRECLEERTAQLAAERLDAERIQVLKQLIKKGHMAVKKRDAAMITELNSDFHASIAGAASNPPMRQLLEDLSKRVRWQFPDVALHRGADSWAEHAAILEALEQGNGNRAGKLVVQHSRRTQEALLTRLLRIESLEAPRGLPLRAIPRTRERTSRS